MKKKIKDLPKEMQVAYKKLQDRPDENTPAVLVDFIESEDDGLKNYLNQFVVNQVVDFADESLLDLELDDKTNDPIVYSSFAIEVYKKVMFLTNIETGENKSLDFYDKNPKIKRLKVKDFTKLGDIQALEPLARAQKFAEFYGVENDEKYLTLSDWEKTLFANKAYLRDKTAAEKN